MKSEANGWPTGIVTRNFKGQYSQWSRGERVWVRDPQDFTKSVSIERVEWKGSLVPLANQCFGVPRTFIKLDKPKTTMAKKAAKKSAKKATKKAAKKAAKSQESQPTLPTLAPPKAVWRKVTRQEYLQVPFTDRERDSYSQEIARSVTEISILEDEKKQQAGRIKAKIDGFRARQKELSGFIRDGFQELHVTCEWVFETSGREGEGKDAPFIHHPEFKTLIRQDTGAVVKVERITESDFHNYQELPLEEKKPEEKAPETPPATPAPSSPKPPEGSPPPPSNVVPLDPQGTKFAPGEEHDDEEAGRLGGGDEEEHEQEPPSGDHVEE